MNFDNVKDKYPNSLSQYNLKQVFENPDLGKLNFSEILERFEKIVSELYILETEDYKSKLFPEEGNQIENIQKRFEESLNNLKNYDPEQHTPQQRQEWINQFNSFCAQYEKIIHDTVVKIKLEKLLNAPEASFVINQLSGELEKLKNEVGEAEKIKNQLESKLKDFERLKPSLSSAGELGIKELDFHFENQAEYHKTISDGDGLVSKFLFISYQKSGWANSRKIYERLIFATVILYLGSYILTLFCLPLEKFESLWGYRSVILFASLLAIEYTGLYFATQNYNKEKNLENKNRNRANIAKTLLLVIAKEDEKIRGEVISNATKTLFSDISDNNNNLKPSLNVSVGDIVASKTAD